MSWFGRIGKGRDGMSVLLQDILDVVSAETAVGVDGAVGSDVIDLQRPGCETGRADGEARLTADC